MVHHSTQIRTYFFLKARSDLFFICSLRKWKSLAAGKILAARLFCHLGATLDDLFKRLPTYLPQLILAQRYLGLLAPGVVIIPHFLVAGGAGAAHLVAVAHLVVELLGFVGLQLLGVGQLDGNVLAGGAGFGVQHPLTVFGAAGEGHEQPVAAFTDGDRQVLGAHLYKFQKEQCGQRIACVERGGRNAAFFVFRKPLARRVVQEKTYVDNDEIKTPFAIIGVRSANCTNKQREVIQNERRK